MQTQIKKTLALILATLLAFGSFAVTASAGSPGSGGGGIGPIPGGSAPFGFKSDPTAVSGLIENGTAQTLITAGVDPYGTAYYYLTTEDLTGEQANDLFWSTGKPGSFSPDLPTATDAGTYYVWYAVDGGSNYTDLMPYMQINDGYVSQKLTVTIAQAHTHHDKTFQPWTATDSLPTAPGSYYLTDDVTISSTWYVPDGTTNLCLNGHGIRYSSYVTGCAISINVNAALNLYDCDTETEHKFTVSDAVANGAGLGVVNDALESGYQTFTGGYITGGSPADNGGGVFVRGSFNMYGGTVIGNQTLLDSSSSNAYQNGGAVYVYNGSFALYGGSIMYNIARGHGGGVSLSGGSTGSIYDGTISGNTGYLGGGVSVSGASVLNLFGGTITDNTATSDVIPYEDLNQGLVPCGADVFGNDSSVNLFGTTVGGQIASTNPIEIRDEIFDKIYKVLLVDGGNSYHSKAGVITNGLNGNGYSNNIMNGGSAEYALTFNDYGEAEFVAAVPVTVDFGTGHAALAAAFAQANSYTVSGTRVTMPAPADAADRWETRNIIGDVVTPYFAALNANPVIDAGERLYSTSEFAPQSMSAYADRDAFNTATEAWLDGVPSAGDVFYLLWESAYTGAMTLALDPLTCGQEVTVSNYGSIATNHTDPQPSYTLTGGVTDKWTDSWYASYDPETGTFGSFASGMIVGGTDYYTFIRIAAPFGYYIANAEETVTVTGAKQVWYPPGYTYNGGVEIALSATAQHGNWETDAIVTLEPTEYAEGEITYYCAVCDGVVRTEAIPVLTYHNVTVANNIQNGTVGVSTNRTYVGSTVTVTATPDNSELFLYSLCYSGDGQQDVTITEQDGIYSFIMPDYDVTVHGEFMLKNTVFVDFGAGHESFVQAAFGEAEDFTVNGSVVSFRFVPEWEELNNARGAKEMFEAIQNTYIQYNERMDNGESYMYAVALHPLAYYTQTYGNDAEAYVNNTENDELRDLSVENSITFYALWAQPVADAVVTVTPPACGTVMTTYYRNSTVQVLPSPVMTATGGLGFEDYMIFYNNWDIGLHDGETTTLTGGNAYTAYGFLTAPWGSFLPDDLTGAVSFEGGTLTSWDSGTRQFRLSVPVYHNYNANDICTGCGRTAPTDYQSVSIADQIALNLLLDLDARGKTTSDVTITLGGNVYEAAGVKQTEGDYAGLYKFTVIMAPAQIADDIVVSISGDQAPLETSIKSYCQTLCGSAYDEDKPLQDLAKAILQYGQTANNVLGYTDDPIADISDLSVDDVLNAPTVLSKTMTEQVTGASFMALTKPEFRFYTAGISEPTAYRYNQAGITVTMDAQKPDQDLRARFVRKESGDILLEVTGVSAENMDKTITVTINGMPEGQNTITFNGNAFAKAMASSSSDTQLQNLGAALYNYGAAAKTYFDA